MNKKNSIYLSLLLILLLFIGSEVFIVLRLPHKSTPTPSTSAQPVAGTLPDGGSMIATPVGTVLEAKDESSFLLAADLGKIYIKNKEIFTSIHSGTESASIPILLSSTSTKATFLIAEQRTPDILPRSVDTKYTNMKSTDLIPYLTKLVGQKVIFYFQLKQIVVASKQKAAGVYDSPIFACNNAFLLYTQLGVTMPQCTPFAGQIHVYVQK